MLICCTYWSLKIFPACPLEINNVCLSVCLWVCLYSYDFIPTRGKYNSAVAGTSLRSRVRSEVLLCIPPPNWGIKNVPHPSSGCFRVHSIRLQAQAALRSHEDSWFIVLSYSTSLLITGNDVHNASNTVYLTELWMQTCVSSVALDGTSVIHIFLIFCFCFRNGKKNEPDLRTRMKRIISQDFPVSIEAVFLVI